MDAMDAMDGVDEVDPMDLPSLSNADALSHPSTHQSTNPAIH
jgi:hypothetical protein